MISVTQSMQLRWLTPLLGLQTTSCFKNLREKWHRKYLNATHVCGDVFHSRHRAEENPPGCLCITVHSKTKRKKKRDDPVFVVHAAAALVTSAFRATPPCLLLLAAALFTSLRLDIEHIRYPVFVRPSQMSARPSQWPYDWVKSDSVNRA